MLAVVPPVVVIGGQSEFAAVGVFGGRRHTVHDSRPQFSAVAEAQLENAYRITSYNVCYTKLLRGAYAKLKKAGAKTIVSCNTIRHASNKIDIAPAIAQELLEKN